MNADLNVVIFTCKAREHLLVKAWESYAPILQSFNHRLILAIDGRLDQSVVNVVQPDVVIQSFQRSGYINSILNALALVDSEYFLWLEDDWVFDQSLKIEDALAVLGAASFMGSSPLEQGSTAYGGRCCSDCRGALFFGRIFRKSMRLPNLIDSRRLQVFARSSQREHSWNGRI